MPLLLSNQNAGWGQKIGLFFGGLAALFVVIIFFMFPETKGRTYQELDELFENKTKPWNFAKTETSHQRSVEARLGHSG